MLRVMGCVLKQGDFTAPAEEMHGKCVVITGPSIGGIGFETALGLAVSHMRSTLLIVNLLVELFVEQ